MGNTYSINVPMNIGGLITVKGYPLTISGVDCFVHRPPNDDSANKRHTCVSEYATGMRIAIGYPAKKAIAEAKKRLRDKKKWAIAVKKGKANLKTYGYKYPINK